MAVTSVAFIVVVLGDELLPPWACSLGLLLPAHDPPLPLACVLRTAIFLQDACGSRFDTYLRLYTTELGDGDAGHGGLVLGRLMAENDDGCGTAATFTSPNAGRTGLGSRIAGVVLQAGMHAIIIEGASTEKPPQYGCTNLVCAWADHTRDTDWGCYGSSAANCGTGFTGGCSACQALCTGRPNCGAVECGTNYCSWWAVGICPLSEGAASSGVQTCRTGL